MGLYNLDKIFKPKSIAVIGASETRGSIGLAIMENLIQGGYEGRVIPVNPKYSQITGIKSCKSLSEADRSIDLAVIATPISTVPQIVRQCVTAGVGGAIIISAGGRETGNEGRELEKEIEKEARKGGVRIIGPNCMGIICPKQKLNAGFHVHMLPRGESPSSRRAGHFVPPMSSVPEKISAFDLRGPRLHAQFVGGGGMIDYLGRRSRGDVFLLCFSSLAGSERPWAPSREVSARRTHGGGSGESERERRRRPTVRPSRRTHVYRRPSCWRAGARFAP